MRAADGTGRRWISVSPNWLWLIIGTALLSFTMAQTTLWFAAWLAPIFLLRFARTTSWPVALPALFVAFLVAAQVAFRGDFMPLEGLTRHAAIAAIALAFLLIYAIDKALWHRLPSLASTLVFPLASTSISYLATIGNALGTAGSEAYTQHNLAVLQLISVTGIWGLVFLMSWMGSVTNAVWEKGWNFRELRVSVLAFAVTVAISVALGTVRLAFFADDARTVRVAAIVADSELRERADLRKIATPAERSQSRALLDPLVDDLIERSAREAAAGARIIVWSEAAARILEEDMSRFHERVSRLASQYQVFIQAGVNVYLDPAADASAENRAIMFAPDGRVVWDYHKVNVTPGDPERPGSNPLPHTDTPYGRLATIICQDDLFPAFVREAGKNDVDLLLSPSNDWHAVADWHAGVTPFRAIENGLSIVRPTSQGVSLAVDPLGQILARNSNHRSTRGEQTLIAHIPMASRGTLYRYLGDALAYAALAGLAALALLAARDRRHGSR